jgi:hypothetical protein
MRHISQYTTINHCLIMAFLTHSADSSHSSRLLFSAISNNRYNNHSSGLYLPNTSRRRKRQNRNINIDSLSLHDNYDDNSCDSS